MKLSRLELSGFKSFADTIELPFGDGVTASVGPNGCGKSNISDAVRWVLGEQRARLLRGQKMEEVIFHGAQKHRPVNLAEVTLYFDNSDGTLPIEFREVAVARRLSRGGQSDYLINNSPVRLRDVQDLLRGTGLGSDAGVVIEAQMIDRLLSDRAEERRSLFEEAAGIGLYRDRKTTTERQLDQTTDDLQRLDDLINEIQREVRSLARQRGKAERYTQYTGERFAIVMELARRDLAQFESRAQALADLRAEAGERLPQARERVRLRESEREAAVRARGDAETRRSDLERRLGEARLEVGRLEGDLNLAGERLQNAAERKTRARTEREQAATRAAAAERDREAAAAELEAARQARASVQMELDLRTQTEEQARTSLYEARNEVRDLEEALQGVAERQRALSGEQTALERDLADLEEQGHAAEQRRVAVRAEQDAAKRRLDETRADADARRHAAEEAERTLERLRHELAARREHEEALRAERRQADEAHARLTARREALQRLEQEREGLAPAARKLLDARPELGDDVVLGPLSDFLRTSQAEAPLVERLFGEWLHAVLVRDDRAVAVVREWHTRERPGPLVLLPATGPAGGGNGSAPLPVAADAPAAAWARALLAGHEVLDGQGRTIRRPNGAVVLAGGEDAGGLLARRADLEALEQELEQAEAQTTALERAAGEAAAAHQHAEAAVADASAAAEAARDAWRDADGAADDAGRLHKRVEREHVEAEDDSARIAERTARRRRRLSDVAAELEDVRGGRAGLEEQLAERRGVLSELETRQEAARERRVHWQVEEAQVSAREAAAAEREARAVASLEAAREEMTALDAELATINRDSGGLADQQQQWKDRLAERRVAVQELEAALDKAAAAVRDAEARVQAAEQALVAARSEVEALSERSHELDLEHTELDGRRRGLIERIEGEWHRPLKQLLGEADPVEAGDTDGLRAEAQRLAETIEQIGPVNALAVEEHAEAQERLRFLETQRDDLVTARDRLREALREIDQTARAMFVETFALVRENFRQVFTTLFEGGECDVRLADDDDPLGSDIDIHAAPRGKRSQRIHLLSSGERALVAISLLFAIYLTKPSPFCLLDEVDAPLDDANVTRFTRLLEEFKQDTQFIVITHNPRTMQVADAVYGVTMQQPGVSTIVGVRLGAREPEPV